MSWRCRAVVVVLAICGMFVDRVAVASPASTVLKALSRYIAREGTSEAGEKVVREVGEEVVERVSARLLREGGEESVEMVARIASKHGPDVVLALDNVAKPSSVIKVLDDLPADKVVPAAGRLSAGATGRELGELAVRHGPDVLLAELKYPGVGGRFARAWGSDGAKLCRSLSRKQCELMGKYVDDVATLPPSQRNRLLEVINRDKDRFFRWLGEFIKENPRTTIGSATFLAVFLPNSERILGGAEIVMEDGKLIGVRKPGLIEGLGEPVAEAMGEGISWTIRSVAIAVAVAIVGLAMVKLRGLWIRDSVIAAQAKKSQEDRSSSD